MRFADFAISGRVTDSHEVRLRWWRRPWLWLLHKRRGWPTTYTVIDSIVPYSVDLVPRDEGDARA